MKSFKISMQMWCTVAVVLVMATNTRGQTVSHVLQYYFVYILHCRCVAIAKYLHYVYVCCKVQ